LALDLPPGGTLPDSLGRFRAAISQRYRIERELGHGGMARVYLALDLKHDRPVAIKLLRAEVASALGPERFRREIETLNRLSHANILPLYESGEAGGELYYVMPFVEGASLRDRLSQEKQLPIEDALRVTLEVADALAYAHQHNVVHRDIKPDNILFRAGHAVVSDFGVARSVTSVGDSLTDSGLAIGTPAYMSPEQASGEHHLDGRSDQYSLACVLYEMLAGDPPYTASSAQALIARKLSEPHPRLSVVRDRVPPHVEAALDRALARVPADRFRSIGDFAAALRTPPALTPGTRVWLTRAGAIVTALAVITGLARARFHHASHTKYPDHSAWAPWGGWVGENIPVVAVADSWLMVQPFGSHELMAYDGETWKSQRVPESLELLPFTGSAPGGRLLAIRFAGVPDESRGQLLWLSARTGATQPLHQTPDGLPPGSRPSWWSEGRDVVTWSNQIWRSNSSGWINEAVGPRGFISEMWGLDVNHRFAISPAQQDSLLAFDGISWAATDIRGSTGTGLHTFVAGATFPDSTTVVVGSECLEPERCRPAIVQQDGFATPWRAVTFAGDVGLPAHFPSDSTYQCGPEGGRFSLVGVAGRSRNDYVLWGSWTRCDPGSKLELSGCPPRQPCAWEAREGRLSAVEDMVGRVVMQVVYIDTVAYAVTDDGSLWRHVGDRWRVVTRVPALPARLVEASPYIVVRATGADLRYEPGFADTLSQFFVAPLLNESGRSSPPTQLVVRDSTAALLTDNGRILVSRCARVRGRSGFDPGVPETATGGPALVLRCAKWSILPPSPGRTAAIAVLPGGRILAVGPGGLAVTWLNGRLVSESLPRAARDDQFWSVVPAPDGSAMAIGTSTIVKRNPGGGWQLVRRVAEVRGESNQFAVLPDGDVVVAGSITIHTWDLASTDSLPTAILYSTRPGETLGPLLVLSDGRLVAGLGNPGQPLTGGRLLVWASPPQANRMQTVELPITVNITSLSSDGRRLYVAGPGGALSLPIDSVPFARPGPH